MRSARVLLVAVVLAPAVGCDWMRRGGGKDDGLVPKPTGTIPQVSAEQLVGYLNDRAGRMQSIYYDDVRMKCYEAGKGLPEIPGRMDVAQPRYFRLKADRLGGDVDMGSNLDQFWVYVKVMGNDPMYVYASHTDFEQGRAKLPGGIPFEPDWVMQALGMKVYDLAAQYTVSIDDKARAYVLSWPAQTPSGLAVRKEVVFDADSASGTRPQVKRHAVKDAATGKVLAYADVKKAATAVVGPAGPSGAPVALQYPTSVVLKWEEQKFEMDLDLRGAKLNEPLTPDRQARFARPRINNVKPIDLAQYEFRPSSR